MGSHVIRVSGHVMRLECLFCGFHHNITTLTYGDSRSEHLMFLTCPVEPGPDPQRSLIILVVDAAFDLLIGSMLVFWVQGSPAGASGQVIPGNEKLFSTDLPHM